MLEICRQRIAALGLERVEVVEADAQSLAGIADASVDAIYAIGLLEALPEPDRALTACARVLKPGGLLVLSTSNGDCPWFSLRDRLFGRSGLRTGRYITVDALVRCADAVGLLPVEVRTRGVAPPGLAPKSVIALLDGVEHAAAALGLSRYMGVLSASFRKPKG
jgi:SAM-dependent methyltransferase